VEKTRLPVHTLEAIICFGQMTVSTPLIGFLGERGVGLTFLSRSGRFLGRVEGPVRGNVHLRHAQILASHNEEIAGRLACSFVQSKVANSRNILLRGARDHTDRKEAEGLRQAASELAGIGAELCPERGVDTLRGLEGAAASIYWRAFDALIRANREHFFFRQRSRRPPLDRMNALLSFGYALLVNDVRSALEAVGLDPATGFLHALRPGRPALALDLMEELRAWHSDRMALSLVNLRRLKGDDFDVSPTGVRLHDAPRKLVIEAWQKRKREEIMHPFIEQSIPVGLVPFVQAQLLARHLRGDLDGYPAFHWK
jgi:CRISPR-associated protein Cas1